MEGFPLFVLTNYGLPEPWTVEEVQVYLAKAKEKVDNPTVHSCS